MTKSFGMFGIRFVTGAQRSVVQFYGSVEITETVTETVFLYK